MEHKLINDSGWLEEKLLEALLAIARAMEDTKRLREHLAKAPIHSQQRERAGTLLDEMLRSHISGAIWHLTLIASVLRNEPGQHCWKDVAAIEENFQVGLVDVLSKYGLSDWIRHLHLNPNFSSAEIQATLQRIAKMVEGPRGESRTLIYDELQEIKSVSATARRILDLLEPVTQGDKSWEDFQSEARVILKKPLETAIESNPIKEEA